MSFSGKSLCFLGALALGTVLIPHYPVALAQAAPEHGRTSDGKPYRIDREGLRISDYIAELEVANDDLKRQLEASDREIEEKDRLLKQAGVGRARNDVRERDLVSSANDRTSCESRLKDLELRLTSAEQKAKSQLQPACDFQSPANPYKSQVEELQARLQHNPSDSQLQSEQDKRAAAEAELLRSKSELSKSREELMSVKERVAGLERDLEEKSTRVTNEASRSTPEIVASRGAMRDPSTEVEKVQPIRQSEPTDKNVQAELRGSLNQIQKLVGERKNLLDALKSKGKAVSVSLRPLVTADGKSLDSFRVEVDHFGANSDLGKIRSGLTEISSILNDDISLLRRLTR